MAAEPASSTRLQGALARQWQHIAAVVHARTAHLPPTTRALLWAAGAGLLFSLLNALMRALALAIDPFQAQFLRYFFGLVVLLPIVWHHGVAPTGRTMWAGSSCAAPRTRWAWPCGSQRCRRSRWPT